MLICFEGSPLFSAANKVDVTSVLVYAHTFFSGLVYNFVQVYIYMLFN